MKINFYREELDIAFFNFHNVSMLTSFPGFEKLLNDLIVVINEED